MSSVVSHHSLPATHRHGGLAIWTIVVPVRPAWLGQRDLNVLITQSDSLTDGRFEGLMTRRQAIKLITRAVCQQKKSYRSDSRRILRTICNWNLWNWKNPPVLLCPSTSRYQDVIKTVRAAECEWMTNWMHTSVQVRRPECSFSSALCFQWEDHVSTQASYVTQ